MRHVLTSSPFLQNRAASPSYSAGCVNLSLPCPPLTRQHKHPTMPVLKSQHLSATKTNSSELPDENMTPGQMYSPVECLIRDDILNIVHAIHQRHGVVWTQVIILLVFSTAFAAPVLWIRSKETA